MLTIGAAAASCGPVSDCEPPLMVLIDSGRYTSDVPVPAFGAESVHMVIQAYAKKVFLRYADEEGRDVIVVYDVINPPRGLNSPPPAPLD